MTLIVHELTGSGLSQIVRRDRNTIVEAIRPHLYRHNFATGSLKIQILDGATLVAESALVPISSITTAPFFHGLVRFEIDAYLAKDTDYTVKLVGEDGYTFDELSYVGWCVGFDLGHYDPTYEASSLLDYPLDLEIWSRSER